MRRRYLRCLVHLILCAAASAALAADDPCTGFQWDVSHEHALFATAAEVVTAGKDVASAPLLMPDRLYEPAVVPQQEVKFAVTPGKKTSVADASAGLSRLHVSATGEYRISLDQSFWLDLVANNHLVDAEDFQGRHGCRTPHKIVLYALRDGEDLILQLSGAVGSRVRLTITQVREAELRESPRPTPTVEDTP